MSSSGNNASVYGGDEINAIVLDSSSFHTRIGYAGDDFPKIITPSSYASPNEDAMELDNKKKNGKSKSSKIFGESINIPRSNHNVSPILKDSVIIDWEAAIEQYHYYFDDVLTLNYKEQPILITEPVWCTPQYRQTLLETFYESFDFPALFLAKSPTCISFQQGRPNCLVVDIGHDSVSVTPVIDGISLLKNSMKTNYGGQYLNDQIEDMLTHKFSGVKFENRYRIKSKTPTVYPEESKYTVRDLSENITQSFDDYQRQNIWHEFKETMLEVPEKKFNTSNTIQANSLKEIYSQDSNKRLFELPTGQSLELCLERFQLADSLFDPQSYKFNNPGLASKYPPNNGELSLTNSYDDYKPLKRARKAESNQSTPPPSDAKKPSSKASQIRGLTHLITHTLSTIDIDLRSSVAHNIIVTGGVSLIPQLTERLYSELSNSNPGLKIRLHAVGNSSERFNQAWIGGSVLASLGTFHQMWVSKQEYEEAGAERILNQRFR